MGCGSTKDVARVHSEEISVDPVPYQIGDQVYVKAQKSKMALDGAPANWCKAQITNVLENGTLVARLKGKRSTWEMKIPQKFVSANVKPRYESEATSSASGEDNVDRVLRLVPDLFERLDADGDGIVTFEEFELFRKKSPRCVDGLTSPAAAYKCGDQVAMKFKRYFDNSTVSYNVHWCKSIVVEVEDDGSLIVRFKSASPAWDIRVPRVYRSEYVRRLLPGEENSAAASAVPTRSEVESILESRPELLQVVDRPPRVIFVQELDEFMRQIASDKGDGDIVDPDGVDQDASSDDRCITLEADAESSRKTDASEIRTEIRTSMDDRREKMEARRAQFRKRMEDFRSSHEDQKRRIAEVRAKADERKKKAECLPIDLDTGGSSLTEPHYLTMDVVIPPGKGPGDEVRVCTPHGTAMKYKIPTGAKPGQTMKVKYLR